MTAVDGKLNAAVKLFGYQQRWLADKSRFKIGLMCRQIGKSFAVSLEAVLDAVESGQNWVLLSAGERQSKELMEKAIMHCKAMGVAAGDMEEHFFEDTKLTQLTIKLANGAKIIGLPANPDTARGFTANVILDEFAFHKDSEKIWRALFPTVSKGYKIRIVSTPQGKGNMFHSLWTEENNWHKHFCDIYQAVKDGVEHDIEELKTGINDEDSWKQEFECLFIDDASSWLTYELIQSCYHENCPTEIEYDDYDLFDFTPSAEGRLFAGFDVARKKHQSIIWLWEQIGDVFWTRMVLSMHKRKFAEQRERTYDVISKWNLERMCIDATGIGAQLAEEAVDKFGNSRVEAIGFTNKVKQDMAVRTKNMFEDKLVRIPNSRIIRDDLHQVKKITTAANNVRFDAEESKIGHADRFWALSLGLLSSDHGVKVEVMFI